MRLLFDREKLKVFDTARGSGVECAGGLDVLVARQKLAPEMAEAGKSLLIEIVSMMAGLIARFSDTVREDEQAPYGDAPEGGEKE